MLLRATVRGRRKAGPRLNPNTRCQMLALPGGHLFNNVGTMPADAPTPSHTSGLRQSTDTALRSSCARLLEILGRVEADATARHAMRNFSPEALVPFDSCRCILHANRSAEEAFWLRARRARRHPRRRDYPRTTAPTAGTAHGPGLRCNASRPAGSSLRRCRIRRRMVLRVGARARRCGFRNDGARLGAARSRSRLLVEGGAPTR